MPWARMSIPLGHAVGRIWGDRIRNLRARNIAHTHVMWHGVTVIGEPSLREKKKRATRDALQAAALRLALERGPENVRVEDIAEAAGVSPRTYNNYLSSREQAILS